MVLKWCPYEAKDIVDRQDRLRVHATQEWHDLYQESTNNELNKFFDFYLKGAENGWHKTPKVRVSLLRYNKVCAYIASTDHDTNE